MKWFFELQEKYRILIAVASWVPSFLMSLIADNVTYEVGFVIPFIAFLALGFVFTFAAARAHDQEKKAEKERLEKEKTEVEAKRAIYS